VRPDLASHVATIEEEATRLGLAEDGRVEVRLDERVRGLAPGQSVVP